MESAFFCRERCRLRRICLRDPFAPDRRVTDDARSSTLELSNGRLLYLSEYAARWGCSASFFGASHGSNCFDGQARWRVSTRGWRMDLRVVRKNLREELLSAPGPLVGHYDRQLCERDAESFSARQVLRRRHAAVQVR